MKAQDIQNVVCVGGGTIGASWATYYLWKGLNVTIQDINEEALARAKTLIDSNLDFLVEKDIITTEVSNDAKERAVYTVDMEKAFTNAQFVQESAYESYEVKQKIVSEVDKYAPKAIYASSSSGLLISKIQKFSQYPERCIIAHPFNPPHLIPLVEIVKGKKTSDEFVSVAYDFFKSIDKEPIILHKEVPGHVANRISMAVWREATDLVLNGVCSVKDVDRAVCYGPGLRYALMGPHLIYELANPDGIIGTIRHLGPSMNSWLEDMNDWKKIPDNAETIINEGLQDEMKNISTQELMAWRDDKLIEILKQVGKL
ncbi:3-hydroxyacyl-CoA dehydrogenase family protein [Rummeliibacillus sp. SL167]|uniref:3-hydroxyacyl-CoA dehydrogenase family protein n=1 Tax=Rummeliibacillus sp. SL167 TaxID=2579792 RepID=UPI0011B7D77E|nr:3-hydroxyacyl-CoA dehydrogenase family protein [Rummeliibacillus sp. SL167]